MVRWRWSNSMTTDQLSWPPTLWALAEWVKYSGGTKTRPSFWLHMLLTWLRSTVGWNTGWMPRGPISRPKTSRIFSTSRWMWLSVWWESRENSGSKTWKTQYVCRTMCPPQTSSETSSGCKAYTWSAVWRGWPHAKLWWEERSCQMQDAILYMKHTCLLWRATSTCALCHTETASRLLIENETMRHMKTFTSWCLLKFQFLSKYLEHVISLLALLYGYVLEVLKERIFSLWPTEDRAHAPVSVLCLYCHTVHLLCSCACSKCLISLSSCRLRVFMVIFIVYWTCPWVVDSSEVITDCTQT